MVLLIINQLALSDQSRNPPAPFERKEWTDINGMAILTPTDFPNNEWMPQVTGELVVRVVELSEVSDSTDNEGWHYSTSFDNIHRPREGGRACKRSTDRVRRRKFIHKKSVEAFGDGLSIRNHHSVNVQRGLQQFMMLLAELNSKRKIWDYLPWDPIAWLLVHTEHQEYLNSFQELQMELKDCLTNREEDNIKTLLNDLVLGASISRAAYGYAMAAGHLDTLEAFVTMHAVHSQHFNPVTGASVDANIKAVCDYTGYCKEDIVMSDWTNREYKPCHFIAKDHQQKRIVLAIRGSMEMGDLVTDISGAPIKVEIGGVSGLVHEGSMVSAIYIQCNTETTLQRLLQEHPDWSLFITGHSIGGGIAALLAMILKFERTLSLKENQITCVAIGPAAVMSENLAELCKQFVTSLVVRSDVVPRLSGFSIESLMVELVRASPMKKTVDSIVQTATSAFQTLKQKFGSLTNSSQQQKVGDLQMVKILVEDESVVAGALHAISAVHTDSPRESPRTPARAFAPLYPPGRLLWLLGNHLNEENKNKRKKKEPWWDQIHSWSKKTLFKGEHPHTKQSKENNTDSVFKGRGDLAMEEKVVADCSWLEEWMKDHPQNVEEGATNEKTSAFDGVLIEAERKGFSRLLMLPNMIQDHLPNSYFFSITKLKEHFIQKSACLKCNAVENSDQVLSTELAHSVLVTRRVFFLYSISTLPVLAVEGGVLYRDNKMRYVVTIPKDWIQDKKPGADSYFYSTEHPRTNIGITVNPVRLSTTQSFGSLQDIRERLLNAERQKDGFLDLQFLEESAEQTESGSDFNIYAYRLDTTRGKKAIVTGVVIANYQLFIVNGTCRCEKDATDCGNNNEFRTLRNCVRSFKLV
eukprot:g6795.t1